MITNTYNQTHNRTPRGTTNRGVHSETKNQTKKHIKDVSCTELREILDIVELNNLHYIQLSNHVRDKVEVSFSLRHIQELLESNNLENLIIEVNVNFSNDNDSDPEDIRILVRDSEAVYTTITNKRTGQVSQIPCNMCFVYSLTSNRLITVYWNLANDNHDSIDWNRYVDTDFYPYLRSLHARKEASITRLSQASITRRYH